MYVPGYYNNPPDDKVLSRAVRLPRATRNIVCIDLSIVVVGGRKVPVTWQYLPGAAVDRQTVDT